MALVKPIKGVKGIMKFCGGSLVTSKVRTHQIRRINYSKLSAEIFAMSLPLSVGADSQTLSIKTST